MAVFGVPQLHEDDALRAVRAAIELRDGVELDVRIGVNTGQVVTGTGDTLVTGDAVNIAARLEQAAGPGDVLVGGATYRLVRDAVEAERLPPLEAKGKSEPLTAYRLLAITGDVGRVRRLDAPLVGRTRESRMLADAWDRVRSQRTCTLFTILGTAGVGKSRLARDFLDRADARVVSGRCLSYGEGITYWPAVEIVKQLLRDDTGRGSGHRRAARCRPGLDRGDRVRGAQADGAGGGGAAARCRARGRALGGAGLPRPRRAHCRLEPWRADPAPVPGTSRAARAPIRLGRWQAQRGDRPARAARAGRERRADRRSPRRARARSGASPPDPRCRRGKSPLRRGDARDDARARERPEHPLDDPDAARRTDRPAAPVRARGTRARGGGGAAVPPGRRPGACSRGAGARKPPRRARAQRARPAGRLPAAG